MQLANVLDRLGQLHEELGRGPEAADLRAAARAVRAEAGARRGAEPTDEDLRFDAWQAYAEGRYRAAVELFDAFLARQPSAVDEIYRRGRARLALGDREGAIVDLRVALALVPDNAYYRLDLGRALGEADRRDEAQTQLEATLDGLPQAQRHTAFEALADNRLTQGRAAFAAGDRAGATAAIERAEHDAARAVELAPDSVWAHLDLGAALMERQRLLETPDPALIERAVTHYERARALLAATSGATDDPARPASWPISATRSSRPGRRIARSTPAPRRRARPRRAPSRSTTWPGCSRCSGGAPKRSPPSSATSPWGTGTTPTSQATRGSPRCATSRGSRPCSPGCAGEAGRGAATFGGKT